MVASVRHTEFTNATGAVVVAGGATVEKGQDYGFEVISRTLAAADVDAGAGAGTARHAAGMIFAEFKGIAVKSVPSLEVFRVAGGITYRFTYLTNATAKFGYSFSTTDGITTLRFKDGAAGNGLLVAGDIVVATVEVGNS
ncbi:MAG: hypothetical protein QN834_09900 [Nitrososphaeraceae archaeon]|nr:hypothetical protein [Nitrososphaeraceae archaeon]